MPIALGDQLRPHVVWFGEAVPMIEVATAHQLLIVGTSLQVYPAAGLVDLVNLDVPVTVIDPGEPAGVSRAAVMRMGAVQGVAAWVRALRDRPDADYWATGHDRNAKEPLFWQ